MWHGAYFNFLEEGRIDALNKVGITYSELSKKGYELPVIRSYINYKLSFIHGEKILLKTKFKFESKIRISCKTLFVKLNGDIGADSKIDLVVVRKKNETIKLIRELPQEIFKTLLLLEEGP